MKKYLLTLEEINNISRFGSPNDNKATLDILEIERYLMIKGIKPVNEYYWGINFANGSSISMVCWPSEKDFKEACLDTPYIKTEDSE